MRVMRFPNWQIGNIMVMLVFVGFGLGDEACAGTAAVSQQ
jgi:hypothetical protein